MPARPNALISRQKAISSKRQKPAGLRRRGQDGRNLIRRIQPPPPPPSLQKRSVALRSEREERGTQWKDCFPCRENFSMFIRDIGLPDESGRGGGRAHANSQTRRRGKSRRSRTNKTSRFVLERAAGGRQARFLPLLHAGIFTRVLSVQAT